MRHIHHHHHLGEKHHHNKRLNMLINKTMWVIALLSPISVVPQIFNIYVEHQVAGVSIITWLLSALAPIIWLAYGILHKDRVIILTNTLWFIVSWVVVVGILLFR